MRWIAHANELVSICAIDRHRGGIDDGTPGSIPGGSTM
jgi:hypothetical protein